MFVESENGVIECDGIIVLSERDASVTPHEWTKEEFAADWDKFNGR